LLSLQGVASPSLLIHGGVGLDRINGHATTPTKPYESGIYDGGGAHVLLCAPGSRMPHSGGGIRHGMRGVLRAGVWYAITPISLLFIVVLWLGTASLDHHGVLAHGGLMRFGTMGTTSLGLGRKEQGACHESAHLA
jgi:hypothetical protein